MAWRYRLCRPITKPLVSLRMRFRPRVTVLPLRARTMGSHSSGPGGLHLGHHLDVLLEQPARLDDLAAQVPLALAGLVTVQVLLARLAAFELARGGHAEAL